jgi:hypothetical protein
VISPGVKIKAYLNGSPLSDSYLGFVKEAVQRGIPQGSSASPYIASMLLGPTLEGLPFRERVVGFCDDIAIGACTIEDATAIKETLQQALEQHPAGPLRLKRCEIGDINAGFDFVKYRHGRCPSWFGGGYWSRPSHSSYRKFEAEVVERTIKANTWPEILRYMALWTKSFRRWKPNAHSYTNLFCTAHHGFTAGLAKKKTM